MQPKPTSLARRRIKGSRTETGELVKVKQKLLAHRAERAAENARGETYIQFAARLTANFQYYCSLRKVNSFESLCDLIISDKLFETLNKETATHIGIREAEDWFRPIDLAKERIFQPWQWKRRKREIVLNRRPELYRGKYRCVQPKDQLVEKDVLMPCETQCFPVEPSGCRRGAFT
ncbi:uncharacterized protein TNCV_3349641 [Trichonephila clavipes]|nr:uncharacterized protein TNCV_3349641 [Trichonephila clavipes]